MQTFMIAGSIKSATLWPSQISGILSYFSDEFIKSQYSNVEKKKVMFTAVSSILKYYASTRNTVDAKKKTLYRVNRRTVSNTA